MPQFGRVQDGIHAVEGVKYDKYIYYCDAEKCIMRRNHWICTTYRDDSYGETIINSYRPNTMAHEVNGYYYHEECYS